MKFIHWSSLIVSLWVLVSPWALGYSFVTPALWSAIISGVLIFILAIWGIFGFDDDEENKLQ
ncbi:MAG: hypothetical protein G01um10143_117 [Parcubacteria group bacterium Gr01-1014_3]|nr:MAG: hypothetical protein G01um10143_117 [Parcubacteria group bacterium Gr01-1014_3]